MGLIDAAIYKIKEAANGIFGDTNPNQAGNQNFITDTASNVGNFAGQAAQNIGNFAQQSARNVGSFMTQGENPLQPFNPLSYTRPLPKFNLPPVKTGGWGVDMAVNNLIKPMAESFINTPYNLQQGGVKTVRGIMNRNPQQALAGAGQFGEGALNLLPFAGEGALLKQAGKSLIKPTLGEGILQGAKIGAGYGAAYGLTGGLQSGENIKNQTDYINNLGISTLTGAASGGLLAGGVGAVGGGLGSIIRKIFPQASEQEITQKASQYVKELPQRIYTRGERGRFATPGEKPFIPQGRDYAISRNQPVKVTKGGETIGWMDRVDQEIQNNMPQPGLSIKMVGRKNAANTGLVEPNITVTAGGKVKAKFKPVSSFNQAGSQKGRTVPQIDRGQRQPEGMPYQISKPTGNQPGLQRELPQANISGSQLPSSQQFSQSVNDITQAIIDQPGKPRGLVTSVQGSIGVLPKVKIKVAGTYIPKTNTRLMGEAQALLQDGARVDLKHVQNADQKVAATIQEAINQQKKNPQLAANLFNNLSEQGTELGRGVQAFSLLNKMSPEAIALSAAGKIKKYNQYAARKIPELSGEQVKIIADKVSALKNLKVGSREHNIAVNELSKTINGFIPSSLVDKAMTVWKAFLLTSLRTHERNLLGNTIMSVAEIAKDAFASPVDRLMALKTGNRSLVLNTQGMGGGIRTGLTAAKDIVQKGYDPEQTIAKFDQKTITWGNNPLEQALKKGTDFVFRTLGGEDKPFLHGATARSLYEQAKVAAINAGKAGDQNYITKLIANPTEQMVKLAEKDANYATFHDKNVLGEIASGLKRIASNPKYGKWGEFGKGLTEFLMPFTGVPSSIVGKTIDYSPLGLTKGVINVGRVLSGRVPELQRQAAQEVGRGVIGTGLFGLGAYLMSKGLMTGQPKDAKESALWQAQGKGANSVLVNGKWRNINSIGPQNLIALAGAKYQAEMNSPDGSLGSFGASLLKDQLSQTFLQGVQGPLNAINDPNRYAKSYVGNSVSSVIPNIVKDTSKALDPAAREMNSPIDYLKAGVPGLRNTLLPKRDVLGNVIPQSPTGIGAYTDLFNSKTPVKNDVINELTRLTESGQDVMPGKLGKAQTIQGVKQTLTPEQLNSFKGQVGAQVMQNLGNLFQMPDYQALGNEEKATAVDSVIKASRTQVKSSVDPSGVGVSNSRADVSSVNGTATDSQAYTLISPAGKVKRIDLSTPIEPPTLTGNKELDKKLVTKYRSELSSRANDITALYKAGKITANTAEEKLQQLQTRKLGSKGSGRKPKRLKLKPVRVPRARAYKRVRIKIRVPKFGKVRLKTRSSNSPNSLQLPA